MDFNKTIAKKIIVVKFFFMSIGVLYMIISSFIFSIAYTFIKQASIAVGFWQTVMFRSLIGLVFVIAYMKFKNDRLIKNKDNWKLLFLRGFLGASAMILYFYALKNTTLASATSLHFTHPLFTTILAIWLLGEEYNLHKIGLVILALVGVLMIFRPGQGVLSLGSLAALVSGFLASSAYMTIRKIAKKEHPLVIMGSLAAVAIVFSLPGTIMYWEQPSSYIWFALLMAGVLTTLAQFFMTLAYTSESASYVAAFSFITIFWSMLLGRIVFGELPSFMETFGIILIFSSMVTLVVLRNRRKKHLPV